MGFGTRASAPGLQIANTTFDFQHNDAVPHMIATNGGGSVVHFTYVWWDVVVNWPAGTENQRNLDVNNGIDRFVHLNTFDPGTGAFLFGPNGTTIGDGEGDPKRARAGYPTLDIDDQDRAIVGLQTRAGDQQPSGDFSSWVLQQQSPKLPVFLQEQLLQSAGTVPNPDDDIVWPHVTVDQIGGTWDVYHVVAHTYSSNDNIVYWRYRVTDVPWWQGPIVLDSTPMTLSYMVAADRTSEKIALITNDSDTTAANPFGLRQVSYRESTDNGTSWINGTGLGNSHEVLITSYSDPSGPQAWLECVGDYDNGGDLHIVWVEQHDPGSSLKHWDKASERASIIASAYYDNKGMTSGRKINIAFPSIGFGDGSTVCNGQSNLNYLYVTYVQFGGPSPAQQNDKSLQGYMNGDIYLCVSADSGGHWCQPVNLTNSPSPGCDPTTGDSCQSENWPSIARTIDDTIHIMYVADRDAGDAVFGQGTWTYNPVMYYRIPGGTDVAPVCPAITPVISASLSNANGPECEYHAGPGGASIDETLTLGNTGNGAMTGNIGAIYINPPSGNWLTISGAGAYTIPVGAPDLTYPVTMNPAGLSEGLYQAGISITHNDTTQPSPLQVPVDFFVFNVFQCSEYVVLNTHWLWLEVSNVGRLTRGNPHGGLYRWPLPGTPDSGNSSIRDASLLIAKAPTPDTFIYRNIYGAGNGQPGFRALSPLIVDTSAYGTNAGVATARTSLTTIDSTIGIDVQYSFPQHPDSSEFVIVEYRIYNRTSTSMAELMIGQAADLDVLPSSQYAALQVDACNEGGMASWYNLVYQQGVDSGATTQAERFLGGMTAIQCELSPRAWTAPSNPWLTTRPGGGFHEGYLYQKMVMNDFEIMPQVPPSPYGADRHSVIVFERNVSLSPGVVKHYQLGLVSSTKGPANTDLINTVKKAWRFAFGWREPSPNDLIETLGPVSIPYFVVGTHEGGVFSGCCGCVVYKVSDPANQFTISPGPDPCQGTITFANTGDCPGTYTATFRVQTPDCGGGNPRYTDDCVVTVRQMGDIMCPDQGDLNGDMVVDVFDVIAEIDVAFRGAPTPDRDPSCPTNRGDVYIGPGDAWNLIDVFDVIRMIEIAFIGGSPDMPCWP
jgi:hypothetical protein